MRKSQVGLILAGLMIAGACPQVRAEDDKPIRALFVCGGCCHDYKAQKDIIPKGISARANVEWTVSWEPAGDTRTLNSIYKKEDWAKGFDVVVHDECSADVAVMETVEKILQPHKDGLPGVVLHCGMHCYRTEGWNHKGTPTPWQKFLGLQSSGHGQQIPISITYLEPDNEITKGLENWTTIHEELYNNFAGGLLPTAHALAHGKQISKNKDGTEKVDETIVTWTNLYNEKAKVFCTTIGHNNDTCNDPKYLDLVTRGLLWSVGKLDADHLKPAKKVYMDGAEPKEDAPKEKAAATGREGPKADANGMVPVDLAHGKIATSSTNQGEEHLATMAFDGDGDTRWCASGPDANQWIKVDLGKPYDLTGCWIHWEQDNAAYKYKIEGSADGNTWTMLSDQTDAVVGPDVREHAFVECCGKPIPKTDGIRFVRLTTTGLQGGTWASLFSFEVFGKDKVKADSVAANPKSIASHGKSAKAVSSIKVPPGFDLTLYAAPPDVSYCTAISAAPTGAVFIGIDEDGSLGHKGGVGRVVRAVDSKGTGVADQFTVFAKMEHPRGLIWDDGKLFVLHPPFLSVYYDDNNTGVANRSEVLVTGISTEKMVESRGADHTTNGIRLGIDGWIYIATGDFGCLKATAIKDKTELTFHYGGILRIRPDGTGLEVYSYGTRNIYDVAMDPLMNVFTRDNTNDGDDWNDRLAYDVPSGYYGYPSRFMHFPGEFIDCLADYGGGAPCGSLYVDEPGIPGGLYTVEWGNSQVDRHPLVPDGANFKVASKNFEKFIDLPRGTDIDVDANSNLFLCSWAGGGFSYSGPNVGWIGKLTPTGFKPAPFPDLRKASEDELLAQLASNSHTRRLATQREILRRGDKPAFDVGLEKLIDSEQPLPVRVAAIFTLKLLQGDKANTALVAAVGKPEIREWALRALIDKKGDPAVPVAPFVAGLSDPNPRIRLTAAWALGRLGHTELAQDILPLTADADFLVAHVATNALVALDAEDVCLKAVEPSNSPGITAGALGVLRQIHSQKVVDGLISRIPKLADANTRSLGWATLCRLCYREADWDGSWWSTRPDRTGPYYKNADWAGTESVKTALHAAITSEKPDVVRNLLVSFQKHQIAFPEIPALIEKLAATDPDFQELQVDMFVGLTGKPTAEQIASMRAIAVNEKAAPAMRAKLIRALIKEPGDAPAVEAAVDAIAPMLSDEKAAPELATVRDEFLHSPEFGKHVAFFTKLANSETVPNRELAYTMLMNLSGSRLVKPEAKAAAVTALEKAWETPANLPLLLRSVARSHAGDYSAQVTAALASKDPQVASAAALAAEKLGLKRGSTGPLIETMKYEDVVAAVLKEKGDASLGHDLFQRQGCIACHTTSTKEPQKGPMLGGIAGRYNRTELCESIMKPSAKIAMGFETQFFKTTDGDVIEGFVSRESGEEVEVHNATGGAVILKKSKIVKRGKRDFSIMPEGLVAKLSPQELAGIIAYLESTTGK